MPGRRESVPGAGLISNHGGVDDTASITRSVVVIGMHRSGTSATTGALARLGLSLGELASLKAGSEHNERGFYEQWPLRRINDELLDRLGGTWSGPPELPSGWQDSRLLDELRERARCALDVTFPVAPWVWKDPRTCLTLPFWRSCIRPQPLVVIVLRDPREVVASLQSRDDVTEAYCLALWERYMRVAVDGVRGLPTLVTDYGALVDDPAGWSAAATRFLERHRITSSDKPEGRVTDFVEGTLRRHVGDELPDLAQASSEQMQLNTLLETLIGEHASFDPPSLPPESRPTDWLLAERRRSDRTLHARNNDLTARRPVQRPLHHHLKRVSGVINRFMVTSRRPDTTTERPET